jgi:cell wall-associated NlpC family hydrolase
MKKRAISLIMTFGMVFNLAYVAKADKIQDLNKQLSEQSANYKSATSKVEEIETQIQKLDAQIESYMRKIQEIDGNIKNTEADIVKTQASVEKAQKEYDAQQKLFGQRVRAMYMSGNQGYISQILKAENFGDLFTRVEYVSRVMNFDEQVANNLKKTQKSLEEQKTKLDADKTQLVALKDENQKSMDEIQSSKDKQTVLVEEAKKQQSLYATAMEGSKKQLEAAQREISEIRASAPSYTPSRGSANLSDNNIVAYASNFLGVRYVWGGTSPNGFDCSGFVQYVYAHFGIGLGRTTYDQINNGSPVSKSQLQKGDLVFFGTYSDPHHVGIYVGNGCYIHAPQTGDVVKISSLDGRSDFLTGRRVN